MPELISTEAVPSSESPVPGYGSTTPLWTGPELFVLDGTALLFRSYYGMPSKRGRDGLEIGAVVGVAQLLLGYVRRERPRHMAVVWDSGQHTFRSRIDPRYKANRGDPPDDLEPQFDLARDAVAALGFTNVGVVDYEADDLMATLARLGREVGIAVRLVSPDKDLCQLVRDDPPPVRMQDPKSNALADAAGVRERLGVPPERVIDFLSLVGDSSDNIPGVRGVGPKAAQALIESFGDLDRIYDNLHRVQYVTTRGAKGLAKKLEAGRDAAVLARRLVALVDDVRMELDADNLVDETSWDGPAGDSADALFQTLDAHRLLRGYRSLHERMAELTLPGA